MFPLLASFLVIAPQLSRSAQDFGQCSFVYTVGDDELCAVSLSTFEENCTTFDAFNVSYDIAKTNGLTMDPTTGDLYIIASIGSRQGDRALMRLELDTFSLTTVATYSSNSEKLAGLAYTCSTSSHDAQLYGVTGSQAAHDLYEVDPSDGSLTLVGNLDVSQQGTGVTYNPYDDQIYRVGGTDTLDIEDIDYKTIAPNVSVLSDTYVQGGGIEQVSAIGHAYDNYLFLISRTPEERLYLVNTQDGSDVINVTQLSTERQHKGIVCGNMQQICQYYTYTNPTTSEEAQDDDDAEDDDDDAEDDDDDGVVSVFASKKMAVFVVVLAVVFAFVY